MFLRGVTTPFFTLVVHVRDGCTSHTRLLPHIFIYPFKLYLTHDTILIQSYFPSVDTLVSFPLDLCPLNSPQKPLVGPLSPWSLVLLGN